jgi:type I restriction enzyme S subunit
LGLDTFSQDSAVPGLSREYAHRQEIPHIPLPEQRAIAAFLDRETAKLDTLIAKKERLIELLHEQRSALISHAVTRGLDPAAPLKDSGVPWLGEVPAGWEVKRIKHVLKQIIDTEHKTAPFYPDGEYLVVRTSNIKNGKLILEDAKYTDHEGFVEWTQRGKPEPGDILFTREAPAGEACLVPENTPLCVGQRTVLFRVDRQKLDSSFGLRALYGGIAAEFIHLLSQGSTVTHFNMADIKNIPLLVPTLTEQRAIAAHLDRETSKIDALVAHMQRAIERLREYRTALISAAVTGKIDIRNEGATQAHEPQ